MVKKITILILMLTICIACTAQQASPTETPQPTKTSTPIPSPTITTTLTTEPTPTRTLVPTESIDPQKTQEVLKDRKDRFPDLVIDSFGEDFGCELAYWEPDSFNLVCVLVPVDNDEQLLDVAYMFTYKLGIVMRDAGFEFCFQDDFKFEISMLNKSSTWAIRAITPGNVLLDLVNDQIGTKEEWAELSAADLVKP